MKFTRAIATGAAIVVAGFPLTACGGDGDGGGEGKGASDVANSPDDASLEDFCAVWNDDSIGGGADDSADEQADAAHEAADKLAEVGSPEGMEESARNGYEVFLEFLSDVDGTDIEKFAETTPDPDAFAEALGIDKDDADDVISFITYASQQCLDIPSESPRSLTYPRPVP